MTATFPPRSAPEGDVVESGATTAVDGAAPGRAPSPPAGSGPSPNGGPGAPRPDPHDDAAEPPAVALLSCLAAALATMAAGWVAAGVFLGAAPRAVALLAAIVGPAIVAASLRTRRVAAVQWAAVPAALALGALAGSIGGASGVGLVQRVLDALRGGGLGQPPVPFDAGWRAILVALIVLVGSAAAGLAVSLRRPRAGVLVPVPAVVAASLVQPADAEVLSTSVGLALLVGGLAATAAADLAREGAGSGRFELRRAGRALVLLLALAAGIGLVARSGLLVPEPREDQVIPPRRPEPPPATPDRELFTVESERQVTWRLGTLDVYDGTAWLTPPYDPSTLEAPLPGGTVPTPSASEAPETFTATFDLSGLVGRALPALANPLSVEGLPAGTLVDPRTQVIRLPAGASPEGLRYRVTAPVPPSGAALAAAPPPSDALDPFLEVPPAPAEVAQLLTELAPGSAFDRLQAARAAYYERVVAAGPGNPVDLPPARVGELLAGQDASPFEITAGEALLARWVGVPSRIGYGWFGGDRPEDGEGATSIRPKHGATWLEAWFEGHGWVPIVGTPPRAKSSLSKDQKSEDPSVRPTDELALVTYVPIRLQGLRQAFEVVRFWLVRALPLLALVVGALVCWPAAAKALRRRRRRRWAGAHGPAERVAVAYAELRDLVTDLGAAPPAATPLEALDALARDDDHIELAWLVTRGLWGDLRRDLTDADADAAEALAASVRKRLGRAQPLGARMSAAIARTSLRRPWSTDVPGAFPDRLAALGRPRSRPATAATPGPAVTTARSERRRRRPIPAVAPRTAAGALAAVLALALGAAALSALSGGSGTSESSGAAARAARPLPEPLVPDSLAGATFRREPGAEEAFADVGRAGLVAEGRVYSVAVGDSIEASLQAGAIRASLADRGEELRRELLASLGQGSFRPARFGDERGWALDLPEQRLLAWFAPDGSSYRLLVARRAFADADRLFGAVLAAERASARGLPLPEDPAGGGSSATDVPLHDPRRGLDP